MKKLLLVFVILISATEASTYNVKDITACSKGAFPNDNSLLKLLYAGIQNAEKKWTMPIQNWSLTISQLNIHFKERLKDALALV